MQLFNCDILISSCCATRLTNLDEKFTDEEVNETFLETDVDAGEFGCVLFSAHRMNSFSLGLESNKPN